MARLEDFTDAEKQAGRADAARAPRFTVQQIELLSRTIGAAIRQRRQQQAAA